jgi:phage shock protein PspC (stress-responsive transcriptional regulator)/anti-sigma regulatory factor (Ser/Thr protein kinase)
MTATPTPAPRLLRDPNHRVVAGVASGLAHHLRVPVIAVRLGFFVLSLAYGLGAALYAVFWAVLPLSAEGGTRNVRQLVPFGALATGLGMAYYLSSGIPSTSIVIGWLAALIALGSGIIWRQASPGRRQRWSDAMPDAPLLGIVLENNRRGAIIRFLGGGLLVVLGVIGIVAYVADPLTTDGLTVLWQGLLFAFIGLLGLGVVLAPLLWRMFHQLRAEQEARIRELERAEVAAMIHDGVMHTLTMIQKSAGDSKTVLRLARGQERTLRNWLYRSVASPDQQFSAAVEQAAAEVEDTYAIAVETVIVGDRAVDERIAALVAAAREALVNAARHAEVSTISLYAEVEEDQASVFVRDRGVGFDPSTVDDKRHGVRGSILGRMERHGGQGEIRSKPGDGTEVRLTMPMADPRRRMGDWLGSEAQRAEPRRVEKG